MIEPIISVDALTIRRRSRVIVEAVSFVARPGTLTWITGENGAGKSSLLRALVQQRARRGNIAFTPLVPRTAISYYAPAMGVPVNVSVAAWLAFHSDTFGGDHLRELTDALLPAVASDAVLTRLSTGEAKRLILWSLLRRYTPFTILDEPYEHLSPTSKARLTEILIARAQTSALIVATNQDVPDIANKQVLEVA